MYYLRSCNNVAVIRPFNFAYGIQFHIRVCLHSKRYYIVGEMALVAQRPRLFIRQLTHVQTSTSSFTISALFMFIYMFSFTRILTYRTLKLHITKLKYTECHRRNGPNFGRVFLMLNYTDITHPPSPSGSNNEGIQGEKL